MGDQNDLLFQMRRDRKIGWQNAFLDQDKPPRQGLTATCLRRREKVARLNQGDAMTPFADELEFARSANRQLGPSERAHDPKNRRIVPNAF